MIVYGIHPVSEALRSDSARLEGIWITRGVSGARVQEIIDAARNLKVPLHFENEDVLQRKADSSNHQHVVAQLAPLSYVSLDEVVDKKGWLLVLDQVEDPHNLGAVLRTAEAAGVVSVLLPKRGSCGITPTVIKASAGAAIHLPIARIGNVSETLRRLKKQGYWVIGLDRQGQDRIDNLDTSGPLVIVVGGERGLRRLVRKSCDFLVALPMRGRVESLNLSVATGILLYSLLQESSGNS